MEQTTFFKHYRICANEDGSPNEVSHTGAATNYKAIDTRSKEPVTLQLIPLAIVDRTKRKQFKERARTAQKLDHVNIAKVFSVGVEDDYFGLISEYLEGETVDSWIVAHGPMPADAVLRIGLQVVRAIAAAAFFGLTHRAIQPSNLMIVPGQSPDGGWPFVKLLNFGLAGSELHSESSEARELAPSVPPQFASPEQLLDHEIDFQSQIYSLGATMCFLLTGAVPLAVSGMKARLRAGRLPELRRAPRALRSLLVHMLRENPENRPQDPVAFESELRDCLTKIERRQAIGRRLGIPLAAVIPKKPKKPREPRTPLAQVLRGFLAVAVLLLAATALGAYLFPDAIPLWHRTAKMVGVPDAASVLPPQTTNAAPVAANQPVTNTDTGPAASNSSQNLSPSVQQAQASDEQPAAISNPANAPTPDANASGQIASAANAAAPAPPWKGPGDAATVAEKSDREKDNSSAQAAPSSSDSKKKALASTSSRTSTAKRARIRRALPNEEESELLPLHHGRGRARFVGTTPDGRVILRLPSGRIVTVRPRSDEEDAFVPSPRRRVFFERPDVFAPPPFYPPGYFPND
jgi:serine/threonine protein kinase